MNKAIAYCEAIVLPYVAISFITMSFNLYSWHPGERAVMVLSIIGGLFYVSKKSEKGVPQ